jgi:hypothetical protein
VNREAELHALTAVGSGGLLGCWDIFNWLHIIWDVVVIIGGIWLIVDVIKTRGYIYKCHKNQSRRQSDNPPSRTLVNLGKSDSQAVIRDGVDVGVSASELVKLKNLSWCPMLIQKPCLLLWLWCHRNLFWRFALHAHKSNDVAKQPNARINDGKNV